MWRAQPLYTHICLYMQAHMCASMYTPAFKHFIPVHTCACPIGVCVYRCLYIYMHTHVSTDTHAYTCTRRHCQGHNTELVCALLCVSLYFCTYVFLHLCASKYGSAYVCVCVYICVGTRDMRMLQKVHGKDQTSGSAMRFLLGKPASVSRHLAPVLVALLPIQGPDRVYAGRQKVMAQVLGPVPTSDRPE